MKNRKKYPDEWEDTIRPAILKRDGYKCTVCAAKHRSLGYFDLSGAWIECDEFMLTWALNNNFVTRKIYLQVAHLDQDTTNNNPANLRTYCPRHHLRYDNEYKRLSRLAAKRSR